MNPFDKQNPIPGIRHILAVGSGKGGVGKSTVAANLSVALKELGKKVGLLDADIYGPSVPRLFGAIGLKPAIDSSQKLLPLSRQGIKLMSMGFMIDEDTPVVWRGPMLFKAMEQFFRDVAWGELDYLVIDLPPGTGDVALTVAQKVPVSGGVVVSTPQNLSLVDAKKAISMFEQIKIPILGMVENMAYFRTDSGEKQALFPKGEMDAYLESRRIPKLAQIPFHPHVGVSGEAGIPAVSSYPESPESQAFQNLAASIVKLLP